jgi:hypothetical protein
VGKIHHFYSKVAGVTHINADGSIRQEILGRCGRMEPLALQHDSQNSHDRNAIKVLRSNGEQLGFLAADLARTVAEQMRERQILAAYLTTVTGGGDHYYGANLLIVVGWPGTRPDEIQSYVEQLTASDMNLFLSSLAGPERTMDSASLEEILASERPPRDWKPPQTGCALVLLTFIAAAAIFATALGVNSTHFVKLSALPGQSHPFLERRCALRIGNRRVFPAAGNAFWKIDVEHAPPLFGPQQLVDAVRLEALDLGGLLLDGQPLFFPLSPDAGVHGCGVLP